MLLGVNIDHIAVLREARRINDPDPLEALGIAKRAGADQITIHLREDRRHIHDLDVEAIIRHSHLPINLECSINDSILDIVLPLNPNRLTFVPENRQEVTTEGGLDLEKHYEKVEMAIKKAKRQGIETSLFIDPNEKQVALSKELKAQWVELHTGTYANIYAMLYSNLKYTQHSIKKLDLPQKGLKKMLANALEHITQASKTAHKLGLQVAAGHGLNYQNVKDIATIEHIEELNIGQSIIARSVFVGLENAIKEMKVCL